MSELTILEKQANRLKSPLNPNLIWVRNTAEVKEYEPPNWWVHRYMGANATWHNTLWKPLDISGGEISKEILELSLLGIEEQPLAFAKLMINRHMEFRMAELNEIDLYSHKLAEDCDSGLAGSRDPHSLAKQIQELWYDPIKNLKLKPIDNHEACKLGLVYAAVGMKTCGTYEWINQSLTRYCDREDYWVEKLSAEYCNEFDDWFIRHQLTYSESQMEWIHPDSYRYVFCIDTEDYAARDESFFDDETQQWYKEPQGQRVLQYHERNCHEIMKEPRNADWSIGFEIEKTEIYNQETDSTVSQQGDRVETQPFFWKWETDSSCGIEGVSHAYDLFDSKEFKNDVDKSDYIDGDTSRDSGGHVSIKCNKWGQAFGLNEVRPYAGLIYALWRFRLKNEYCSKNKKIDADAYLDRYDVIRVRGAGFLEFRLPNRVQRKSQVIWRYKIFHLMVRAMVEGIPFASYVRNCDSLLDEVYDTEKKERIKGLSQHFDDYLSLGVIASEISEFI